MTISEMHNLFRVLGQQLGNHQNRGVTPDAVDSYLNSAIQEKVRTTLITSVKTAFAEQIDTQARSVEPTNILLPLNRRIIINLLTPKVGKINGVSVNVEEFLSNNNLDDLGIIGNFSFLDDADVSSGKYDILLPTGEFNDFCIKTNNGNVDITNPTKSIYAPAIDGELINPMIYTSVGVKYRNKISRTKLFTYCRLVGADTLMTTFRDFGNAADEEEPVISLLSKYISKGSDEVIVPCMELYVGKNGLIPAQLDIRYIKHPNVVRYDVDERKAVSCDLPHYCHHEIVENAVMKFYQSIGAISGRSKDNN